MRILKLSGLVTCLFVASFTSGLQAQTGNDFAIDRDSQLWKYIDSLPVIDTHEHMSSEAELLGKDIDIFDLFTPYVIDNLQAAGMTADEIRLMNNPEETFSNRFSLFFKYYPLIKNSTYFISIRTSLEHEYGMSPVTIGEFRRISGLLKKDFARKGFLGDYLKKYRIESILTFRIPSVEEAGRSYGRDKLFFVPTVSDLRVRNKNSLGTISSLTGYPVSSLNDIVTAVDKLFSVFNASGIRNIKFGTAYNRELNYVKHPDKEAEEAFNRIIDGDSGNQNPGRFMSDDQIIVDDFLTFHMLELADRYNMNAIFHLGLAAWNFNTPEYSHSAGLVNLVSSFPGVNIVILHAGYPYYEEAMLLAKYYPNVYLNMTWDHIIDREKTIGIMKSYIEMLPLNKIHAFGGDYFYPQQLYGHLTFAKENIYLALTDLINKERITPEDAREIALRWLYLNPGSFYFK